MAAVGIIAEYNPLHWGHQWHLQQARWRSACDTVVVALGGHWLQRGEPAYVDKWRRARMALAAGADVVVELPFPWSCSDAYRFAAGGVAVLESLGGVSHLCFGSEAGQLQPLQELADLLGQEDTAPHAGVKHGQGYPQQRQQWVAAQCPDLAPLLTTSNNILALAYLRALQQRASGLTPLTVPRQGDAYQQATPEHPRYASATAIRRLLRSGGAVASYVPPTSHWLLQQAHQQGLCLHHRHYQLLVHQALLAGAAPLARLAHMPDGLGQRMFQAALYAADMDHCLQQLQVRHLTRSRLQRLMAYALLGYEQEHAAQLQHGPGYIQLLGCSQQGRRFLAASRRQRLLPLVQNFSRVQQQLKAWYRSRSRPGLETARAQLAWQDHSMRLYTLLLPGWQGLRHADYSMEPVTDAV